MNQAYNSLQKSQPTPINNQLKSALQAAFLSSPLGEKFCRPGGITAHTLPQDMWDNPQRAVVKGCPLNVPAHLAVVDRGPDPAKRVRIDPTLRYPRLAAEMRRGYVTPSTVAKASIAQAARNPIVWSQSSEGLYNVMFANVRGSVGYSRRSQSRITHASIVQHNQPGTTLFVTLTYQPGSDNEDLFVSWHRFRKIQFRFLAKCRKFAPCSYISVLESTLKGRPHAHISLKFLGREYITKPGTAGRLRLRSGRMFAMLKSFQPFPQFSVEVIPDQRAVGYMSKYICKALPAIRPGELAGGRVLTEEEIKTMQGTMIPILCKHRQFSISQSLRVTRPPAPEEVINVDMELLDASVQSGIFTAQAVNSLETYLNKLISSCGRKHGVVVSERGKTAIAPYIGHDLLLTDAEKGFIDQFSVISGCHTCIVQQVLGINPRPINKLIVEPRKDSGSAADLADQATAIMQS